jgi:hypothetical protein
MLWDSFSHERPKTFTMVKLFKVTKLMDNEVVLEFFWKKQNFVVEV